MSLIEWIEPKGRYEDNYGQYISFFADIAARDDEYLCVVGAPWSWAPLMTALDVNIHSPIRRFRHCEFVERSMGNLGGSRSLWANPRHTLVRVPDRTLLEVLCGLRPELVEVLYRLDTGQMKRSTARTNTLYGPQREFIVTTNGSFFRPEVLAFLKQLKDYTPPILRTRGGRASRKVLLVPCAADKPYPAPLHAACLARLPPDYYMACATGVLGLAPQELWPIMPHYDSGIPNQWRLYETIVSYFGQHAHDSIVVYCDFYAHVIAEAFQALGMFAEGEPTNIKFVLGTAKYDDYANLMSPENLALLEQALAE
jgi:hypothetical protein